MKRSVLIFVAIFFISYNLLAQTIFITKTYSANGEFYIRSIPYDDEYQSLRGKSSIYNKHNKLLYTIDRAFNDVSDVNNFLCITNDGKTVVYAIRANANEKVDGLKSVSVYKNAKLVKSFTISEFTKCDPKGEHCWLMYSNYDRVVSINNGDRTAPGYKMTFRDNVSDEEKFLSTFSAFLKNDSLYITDPSKVTHIIDLKSYILTDVNFSDIYPKLKNIVKKRANEFQKFMAVYTPDPGAFPNLNNGDTTGIELAKVLGMRAVRLQSSDYFKYKIYRINIDASITKNGKINIVSLTADKPLPVDKITAFFKKHTYDVSFYPEGIDKWYFNKFFWGFRNANDEIALHEKQVETNQRLAERERRLTLDSIDHIYIPKNMEDCMIQLDKDAPQKNKDEMRALKSKNQMANYHLSLGMWIRNYWGLHGGSRLLVYFQNRGFDYGGEFSDMRNEMISTIILDNYYDWLNGNKNIGKEFEASHPLKIK
jgi:hypothetical protein